MLSATLTYLVVSFQSIHGVQLKEYRDFVPNFVPRATRVMPLIRREKSLGRVIYGRYPYWRGDRYTSLRYDLLTDISWFGIELNGRGDVANWHGWPSQWTDLINLAHSNGVRVHLSVACMDPDQIDSIILVPENTRRAVSNIVQAVEAGGVEGVTIDFEFPRTTSRDAFTTFMTVLRDSLKARNPNYILTYDYFALDDYWGDHYDQDSLEELCDFVYVMGYDYHWGGSEETGPVAPLIGWQRLNVRWTMDHLNATTNRPEKYLLGVPYYAYRWPASNPYPHAPTTGQGNSIFYSTAIDEAAAFGLRWDHEGETVWYRYGNYQVWFDDTLSLRFKYNEVLRRGWAGIGIWALTYDYGRDELWNLIDAYFNRDTIAPPPERPIGFYVHNMASGVLKFEWPAVESATGYRIYRTDGNHFELMADISDTFWTSPAFSDGVQIFVMTAYNEWGESDLTEMLAVRSSPNLAPILLVDGVERERGTWNTRNFSIEHAEAIYNGGAACDAASNDMVRLGKVSLSDYEMVDWILGEEGVRDTTLAPDEQDSIAEYIAQGGALFISGAEIGYDLVEHGTSNDRQFYNNVLLARYMGDDAQTHAVTGVVGDIFDGLSFEFDDGTHGHYDVDYPDMIDGYGGSRVVLLYSGGSGGGAGIAYRSGLFEGRKYSGIVYFGFPFETIYDTVDRNQVMRRILDYYGLASVEEREDGGVVGRISVEVSSGMVVFRLPVKLESGRLRVFDIAGRKIDLVNFSEDRILWSKNVAAGVYFYKIEDSSGHEFKGKFLIVR